jgi:hypothetical protein
MRNRSYNIFLRMPGRGKRKVAASAETATLRPTYSLTTGIPEALYLWAPLKTLFYYSPLTLSTQAEREVRGVFRGAPLSSGSL